MKMKNIGVMVGIVFVTSCGAAKAEIKHRFVCMDNYKSKPQLIYVDQKNPAASWVTPLKKIKSKSKYRSIQLLDGGRLLINHCDGAGIYSLETGKLIQTLAEGLKDICTAWMLDDGRLLMGGPTTIYVFDSTGHQIKEIKLLTTPEPSLRLMGVTENETILYATVHPECVVEIDFDGKLIWQAELPAKGYKHQRLKNGNVLNSTGNLCSVLEIDEKGNEVRHVGGKGTNTDLGLDHISGWDLLPNGNLVVANWLGHGKIGKGSHLIEFSPDNQVVWSWVDHQMAKTITNVLVLE